MKLKRPLEEANALPVGQEQNAEGNEVGMHAASEDLPIHVHANCGQAGDNKENLFCKKKTTSRYVSNNLIPLLLKMNYCPSIKKMRRMSMEQRMNEVQQMAIMSRCLLCLNSK